jgi:hypothetical protein
MVVQEAHAGDRQPAPDKRPTKTVGYGASLREPQNCEEKHHNNAYAAPRAVLARSENYAPFGISRTFRLRR